MKLLFVFLILICMTFLTKAQIIDGYTNKQSYNIGETVEFYIKSFNCLNCETEFYINTVNGDFVYVDASAVQITIQKNPQIGLPNDALEPWENGYGYAKTASWTIPPGIKSGRYLLDNKIPFIIKGNSQNADIVVVCATNTETAYNIAGGKSMYYELRNHSIQNNDTKDDTDGTGPFYSPVVSILRPLYLQCGSGSMDYMSGFLKWIYPRYPSGSHSLNVIADSDMNNYSEIENANLIIIIGHSEYWTREARENFDKFVASSTPSHPRNAIVLSGNTMWWQVRYTQDNKMICYKGHAPDTYYAESAWATNDPNLSGSISDQIYTTIHWNEPVLNYSILGSIGADYGNGSVPYQYGNGAGNFGGFSGFKILTNSPLLNNTDLSIGDTLTFATGEYDATLIDKSNLNPDLSLPAGQNPKLDVPALGFYRAEMVAYDSNIPRETDDMTGGNWAYYPLIVFQKTATSGKVINVSANFWCNEYGMGGQPIRDITPDYINMRQITDNMINLLLDNQEVFSTSTLPTSFRLKPADRTVSYKACANQEIHITPGGVQVDNSNQGYFKVDKNSGTLTAGFLTDCPVQTNVSRIVAINNTSVQKPADMQNTNSLMEEPVIPDKPVKEIVISQVCGLLASYEKGSEQLAGNSINDIPMQVGDNSIKQMYTDNLISENSQKNGRTAEVNSNQQLTIHGAITNYKTPIFNVSVFPNPTNGKFTISISGSNMPYSVDISNYLGTVLYRNSNVSENALQFDMSNMPGGIYLIRLNIGGSLVIKRLVVQ